MKSSTWSLLLAAAAGGALAWFTLTTADTLPRPKPPAPAPLAPAPEPDCPDCPRPSPRPSPWPSCGGPRSAGDESEPTVDLLALPKQFRKPNITSGGLGCCVWRSIDYAARWQNVPALHGFPEWLVQSKIVGGGVPSKVRRLIPEIAKSRGLPTPRFVQYEGNDPSVIELALKTGRPASITWNGNHMLTCLHLDNQHACILDNNSPDGGQWFKRATFLQKWKQGGGGWVVVLLDPGPPPPPIAAPLPKLPRPSARQWWRLCAPCSPACVCGCNEGCVCGCGARPVEDEPPAGVSWTFSTEKYQLDGEPCDRAAVEAALADDSAKAHLTLIGTEADRKAALAVLGDVSGYKVQSYDPSDWAVQFGHVTTGKPTVYLQRPDGTVLLRADDLEGLVGKLRRSDPNYQPKLDPTGQLLPKIDIEGLKPYAPYALGLAGAAAAMWWARRQGQANRQVPPPAPPATQPASRTDELLAALLLQMRQQQGQQPPKP